MNDGIMKVLNILSGKVVYRQEPKKKLFQVSKIYRLNTVFFPFRANAPISAHPPSSELKLI